MLDGIKPKLDGGSTSPSLMIAGSLAFLLAGAGLVYALNTDDVKETGSRVQLARIQHGAVTVPDDQPPPVQPVVTTTQPTRSESTPEDDTLARRQAPAVIYNGGAVTAQATTPIRPSAPPEQVPYYTASYTEREDGDFTIMTGRLIPATLLTEVNSDLPGPVVAIISQPVYGETGRLPVLSPGTRLFGRSISGVRTGQDRVGILWTRAIAQKDDGSIMNIDFASAGTDQLGTTGTTGEVDTHFWEVFGNAILISLVGGAASAVPAGDNQVLNNVVEDTRTTASNLVGERLNIPPTVHVPHGESINVIVQQDLFFPREKLAAAPQRPVMIVQ